MVVKTTRHSGGRRIRVFTFESGVEITVAEWTGTYDIVYFSPGITFKVALYSSEKRSMRLVRRELSDRIRGRLRGETAFVHGAAEWARKYYHGLKK